MSTQNNQTYHNFRMLAFAEAEESGNFAGNEAL